MKKALTLCGGGSLGSYEIGAVGFLMEQGYEFDIYTGASIGAINAAALASMSYDDVVKLWDEVTPERVVKGGKLPYKKTDDNWKSAWPRVRSMVSGFFHLKKPDISPFVEWISEVLDVDSFSENEKKVGIVATAFPSLKEVDVVLNDIPPEDIVPMIVASSSAFPIFPIHKYKKKKYIDGGYTNNLPIDLAFELGADEVTAIVLRSIPEYPQKPELLSLPNVEVLIPSRDTGTVWDFRPEKIAANKALGYLDAAKRFGGYYGYRYAFEKDDEVRALGHEFMRYLAKNTLGRYMDYENFMKVRYVKFDREVDVLLRPLEMVASSLHLDYLIPYSVREMITTIKKILRGDRYKAEARAFSKKITHSFGILDSEIPAYMAYCLSVVEDQESRGPMEKASQVDTLAGLLYWCGRFLYEKGLV